MTNNTVRWLLATTAALLILGAGAALAAPLTQGASADLGGPAIPDALPPALAGGSGEDPGAAAQPDRPPAGWQPSQEENAPNGAFTPDGSFMDAASLAGELKPDAGLDRTSGGRNPGIYMARDWRPVSQSDFPMVVGGHDLFSWKELEPTEGGYNWQRLDNLITNNAATGKKTAFGITTYNGRIENGIQTPNWLSNYSGATIDCSGWKIPKYWNNVYQTKYRNFVQALANRYKNNANVSWTQIGVGLYGEIQPADDRDDTCVKNAMSADGVSDYGSFWIQTIQQIIDIYMQNFNNGKPVFLVYTPSFVSSDEKCYVTQYGAGKYGMGLFAGGVYPNQTSIFRSWPTIVYPTSCQKWDPIVYWNNSPTATIPIAFESYRYMLPTINEFYWGILNALNKHPDYLNLESDLFFNNGDPNQKRSENFPMMYFADQYLGKTINDTPNVWVAMRDHDPATNGLGYLNNYVWPQYGNYDFWLYQDQNAAGGRTISATTVMQYVDTRYGTTINNPYYDALLVNKGPQGWTTRRTNHATGNDYFYLNIDDAFVQQRGVQSSAVITVTWFDHITTTGTTWALQYRDPGGGTQSRQVNRANSNQWVTSTFYINDASFANGMTHGNDFAIYNGGTADLYVHFVAVGPYTGTPPTATATKTPGGPTDTPTATPSSTQTPTATPTVPSGTQLRINTGGGTYIDGGSQTWQADQAYTPGSWGWWANGSPGTGTYNNPQPIANTSDDMLFQTERYWSSTGGYTITLPNGNYNVNLRFAEIFYTEAGKRKFQVKIQGNTVLDAFDIVATAGAFTAHDVTFPAAVSDGQLGIQLQAQIDGAKVSAIWVYPAGGAPPTATPTATATATGGGPTATPTATFAPGQTYTNVYQQGVSPDPGYLAPDNFISNYGADQYSNYCGSTVLYLRDSDYRDALLKFPLNDIPSNAAIISATLSIYPDYRTNMNNLGVGAYRMLRDWDPCSSNWFYASSGVPWAQAGANDTSSDRSASADDFVTLAMTTTWHTLNVKDMVQTWVSNPSTNKGLILKTIAGGSVQWNVRSGDYPTIAGTRPKLTVVYGVGGPPPATSTATATSTPETPTATATPSQTPGGPTHTPTPTQTQTFTPSPTPTVAYDLRINAGGPNYTDSLGKLWLADKAYNAGSWGYVGGLSHTTGYTGDIQFTNDDTLYRSDHYWLSPGGSYTFDVPTPGQYQVSLYFAETYYSGAGQRVFSAKVNGATVLNNFDIVATTGYWRRATIVTHTLTVTDNQINITFQNTAAGTAMVNGIRVVNLAPATPTSTRTTTVTATPTQTNTPVGPTMTPTATPTPEGCPDAFEPDDSRAQARPITPGGAIQHHNFHQRWDQDWVAFSATGGLTYTISTLNLSSLTDTYLYLYDSTGAELAHNDDEPSLGWASRLVWRAPANGVYFVKVIDAFGDLHVGCQTAYDLQIFFGAPPNTPTATASRTGTATATGTVSPIPTDTSTPTATGTGTVTAVPTKTSTTTPTATATATAIGDAVYCNTTIVGTNRGRPNNFATYSCGGSGETGPERVYRLETGIQSTITARILQYDVNGGGNPDVFILSDFNSAACVPGGYGDGSNPNAQAKYSAAPAGVSYVVVDGWSGWSGDFTLRVECSGVPSPTPTATVYPPGPYRLFLPIVGVGSDA